VKFAWSDDGLSLLCFFFAMKILAGILLAVLLFAVGFQYYRMSQARTTLEKLVAFHTENTRDRNAERWRNIANQVGLASRCYEKSENPKLLPSVDHLKTLKTVGDSAQLALTNMFGSDGAKQAEAYEAYKKWLTSKESLFTHSSAKPRELMFNTFLGLNERLLPEFVITEYQNSPEQNFLVLEDAISRLILHEVEQEMNNFGGCEH
jgi:hypothetical protein